MDKRSEKRTFYTERTVVEKYSIVFMPEYGYHMQVHPERLEKTLEW
jgi:hypothetical protein